MAIQNRIGFVCGYFLAKATRQREAAAVWATITGVVFAALIRRRPRN
ncbi:hypothetical protein NQ028_01120 [Corynebacterium phoceense]|nr:hypothetical protein [Corynebacterium phoceense]MCQ9339747.1 hypothetical protein [Corynebacterium phoceense]